MTEFEYELANDIASTMIAVNDSEMPHEAKIVCAAALYLFAWMGEEHKDLLKAGMSAILAHLIISRLR
jgi:hypothetical protein